MAEKCLSGDSSSDPDNAPVIRGWEKFPHALFVERMTLLNETVVHTKEKIEKNVDTIYLGNICSLLNVFFSIQTYRICMEYMAVRI